MFGQTLRQRLCAAPTTQPSSDSAKPVGEHPAGGGALVAAFQKLIHHDLPPGAQSMTEQASDATFKFNSAVASAAGN